MSREQPIVREVIRAVNGTGRATVWRTHSGVVAVRRGYLHGAPEGTADVCGYLHDGRFLGLEVKDPSGTTHKARAAAQLAWREAVLAAGGVAAQVTSPAEAVALVLRESGARW